MNGNKVIEGEAKALRHDKQVLEARNNELERENKALRDTLVARETRKGSSGRMLI